MWPSASDGRPERRSDDGQMILTAAPAGRKPGRDLLVCGAPLRNRTVDLLLTIWIFLGSLTRSLFAEPAAAAGPAPVATCDWLGKRADCGTRAVRVQAHRAAGSWAAGMLSRFGPWGSVPTGHVQADGQMTVRRSCFPYGWTRNALLSWRFRYRRENLNLCPFPRFPVTGAGDNRSLVGQRSCCGEYGCQAVPCDLHRCHLASRQSKIRRRGTGHIRLLSAPSILGRDQYLGRVSGLQMVTVQAESRPRPGVMSASSSADYARIPRMSHEGSDPHLADISRFVKSRGCVMLRALAWTSGPARAALDTVSVWRHGVASVHRSAECRSPVRRFTGGDCLG